MKHRIFTSVLAICCGISWPVLVEAQAGETGRWESELGLEGSVYENFFQAPDGAPQQDVTSVAGELRVSYAPWSERPVAFYGILGATSWSDRLGDSPLVGAGWRWEGRPTAAEVRLTREFDRPSVDVGDALGVADNNRLGVEAGHRLTDSWEWTGYGEFRRQEFRDFDGRDNDFASVGTGLRYRGWGYLFSPELAVERGERDATDPDEDMDQTDLWLKLRSIPSQALYLSLRYRYRMRDYSASDPGASNFGREDDRQQLALVADYELTPHWSLDLYYAWEDADSTRASRVFDTQLLSLGLGLSF